jgi:signal transduction histidine kinase
MKKIYFIYLTLLLIISCDYSKKDSHISIYPKQPLRFYEIKDSLDSVYYELKSKSYNLENRKQFVALSSEYFYQQDFEKFYLTSKEFEKKAVQIKDTLGIINAKTNLGLLHLNKFNNDSAYYYLTQAEKLSKKVKSKPFLGFILKYKADLLWFQKDYTGAEIEAVKALKIAMTKKNDDLVYGCYITIANSLKGMNKNQMALEYYNRAILKANELNNINQQWLFKASTYNYVAQLFQKQDQHQKVISYINSNIKLNKLKKADLITYCYLKNTVAYSKLKLEDNSCLKQFEETLKISDSINNIPIQVTSNTYLGEYYLSQKDTIKANFYLKEAKTKAHKNHIFEDELHILQLLSIANPRKADFYNKRYITLNDSLQNIERATRDKFARIEFETDEITSEKKAIEIERNQLLSRIWIYAIIGSLILIVIILFFKNKSRKAKTRELLLLHEQQKAQEEILRLMVNQQQKIEEGKQIEKRRISQELHDGIMGRLSSIRLNLYVLNKKTDEETIKHCLEYIKDIQNIEKEIRTIAHDLNKNLFSNNVNFINIVENLFSAIKSHADIEFKLHTDETIDWKSVDTNIKINCYRIIQEALQNIDKYAQAKKVTITMSKLNQSIHITIKDDGLGFDTTATKNGIGITNMQERINDLNGSFSIESAPNKGTKINLTIPN